MNRVYIYSTILLLFLSQTCFSQVYNWAWARGATSNYNFPTNEALQVAIDSSENLFVAGAYTHNIAFGPHVLNSFGGSCFVAKYDSAGNALWAKGDSSVNTNYDATEAYSVCTDAQGNCYVVGGFSDTVYFDSFRLIANHHHAVKSTFLVKYDPNGNVLWAKNSIDSASGDYAWSVAADYAGNICVTGTFSNAVSFDTCSITSVGNSNVFLAKFDSSGNTLWLRGSKAKADLDRAFAVATDLNDNVYITGNFDSTSISFGVDTLFNINPNSWDAFIVKYDSFGNEIWAQRKGGQGFDAGCGIASDLSGNIFLVGFLNYPDSGFIIKYNSSGGILWSKTIVGSGIGCYGVTTDKQGNVYATGGFSGPTYLNIVGDTILFPPSINEPMFIVKYDSTGHLLFAKTMTSGGDDECGIAVAKSGNIYLGGDYEDNTFVLGNDILSYSGGGEQIFVAKLSYLNIHSDINDDNPISSKPTVYPNPSFGHFLIQSTRISSIKIYNCLGEIIYKENVSNNANQKEVNLNVNRGIYLLVISDGEREYRQTLIIE